MYKSATRKRINHHSKDLYGDLSKIKDAIFDATHGVKYRTGEAISDSLDGIREKSARLSHVVSSRVAKRPFKSVGLALLTGVALGYFIHK